MEESILKSIKKILGLNDDYTVFDLDLIIHINSVFSILTQLGVGPEEGFSIEDDSAEWSDFIDDDINQYNLIRSYTFLKVRLMFDPPGTSYQITAAEKQTDEYEWRISAVREKILYDAEEVTS
jgi:hypothetical protein